MATASWNTAASRTPACRTRAGRIPATPCFMPTDASPNAPIALCEVQGYVYLARTLAAAHGRSAWASTLLAARLYSAGARSLREQFEEKFWDDELGMYVLALDGEKRPAACAPPTPGRCCSLASPRRTAPRMAQTLASARVPHRLGHSHHERARARFNPTSYHNGSIWPHDNALIALGFARYGHSDLAKRVLTATMFDAAAHMELRRLPELFCGMRRRRDKGPILYPVACSPQAWAAAAPFAMLQACLGLEVDATQRVARFRYPRLPESLLTLHVHGMPIGDARVDLLLRRHGERRLRQHPQSRGRCGDRHAAEVIS